MNSRNVRFALSLLTVFIAFSTIQSVRANITIDGYTAAANDRFTNDPSFILNGFDLSGIGQTSVTSGTTIQGRWVTAISPNVVVSAYHARPAIGQQVTFYPGNDPAATPVTRNVVSQQRVTNSSANAGSDLWLGVLDHNLPDSITPIAFTNQALTGAGGGSINTSSTYAGDTAYLFGWSGDRVNQFTNQAVGRNKITGYLEDFNFGGTTDSLYALLDTDVPGPDDFVSNEAYLQAGDSGGPVLVVENNQLLLLGTNGFITSDDPSTNGIEPTGSGFNYIGNEAAFINAFVASNTVPDSPPLVVASVEVNDGVSQRSAVDSISIFFDGDVVLASGAVSIVQRSTATAATFVPVTANVTQMSIGGQTVARVEFGSHVRNSENALVDGNYQLTLAAGQVTRAGLPLAEDYVFGEAEAEGFFTYYGDTGGDRNVGVFDLLSFRQVYRLVTGDPLYDYFLDYDASGSVGALDLLQFRIRYRRTLPFTFSP